MTFQAQWNRSEPFKIISVYLNKAISSDRKVATNCDSGIQPTHLGIATFELKIINIFSATESKRIATYVENELFEYIHYCTERNVGLLPNTCNFHRKVSVHFFVNMTIWKMCILEKLNFKISRGSMPPDPPSILFRDIYFKGC